MKGQKLGDIDSFGTGMDLLMAQRARATYEANGGKAGILVPPQTRHWPEVRPADAVLPQGEPAPSAGKAVRK